MNAPYRALAAATLTLSLLVNSALAADAAVKPEQLIKWRQSAFQVLGWNSRMIKTNVEGTFNRDEVLKAATAIAAVSGTNLPSLFVPGTETGKGFHDTLAKPEVFKDTAHFAELNTNLGHAAQDLLKVAQTGDAAAVKTEFGKVNKACKACHDDFKNKE